MPVWHVSASVQQDGAFISCPEQLEQIAVELLADVGGEVEWWLPLGVMNRKVAHYRVTTTTDEQLLIPAGIVSQDAGETGPPMPRRRQLANR
jgi:hypothetical protein